MNDARRIALLGAALVAIAALARPARACGGRDAGDLGALEPVDATLASILRPSDEMWGRQQRPEFRFLYPFWKAHPAELTPLWRFSYGDGDEEPGAVTLAGPPSGPLDAALARGDVTESVRQAAVVIDAIYALPPVAAAPYAPRLWRAVEVVELAPEIRSLPRDVIVRFFGPGPTTADTPPPLRLAAAARQAHDRRAPLAPPAGNPRAASIEYWAFQSDLKTRIPDGWSQGVSSAVAAGTATALRAEIDGWIARHPTHPLLDMARLATMRVFYFAGDYDAAWREAMALYPRRRVRALAEMRYLLLQGHAPSAGLAAKVTDPELATALLSQDALDASRWEPLWRASEAMPAGAVRLNLQERLLAWQAGNAKPGALPPSFPDRPIHPSALWGDLRAIALVRAGQADRALEELHSLPSDPGRDVLIAQAEIAAGHPERAAVLPLLSADARAYLLGVRLDDATVGGLCQSGGQETRKSACFEVAVRRARAGRWSEAVPFVRIADPARVPAWEQVARLAAGAGRDRDLGLARFFANHSGEIVAIGGTGSYRGVSAIEQGLPVNSPERAQVREMMERTTERWLAIEAYVRWLGAHAESTAARHVLAEADDVYNRLVNYGGFDEFFWGRAAPKTPTVAELRRLGAAIRNRLRPKP